VNINGDGDTPASFSSLRKLATELAANPLFSRWIPAVTFFFRL
jgi:hypothetical protein